MNVGVVGLGIIGSRVAENYRRAGLSVRVWNRTPKSVEGWEGDLPALAGWADVIQIFVRDHQALEEVLGTISQALAEGKIVVNSATVSLEATKAAERLVSATGAVFLDVPFTGSREAAAAGQLVYYAAGDAAALKAVATVLKASSKEIIPTGAVGTATILKVATNMVSAASVQILAEAMALARSQGLTMEAFEAATASNANASALSRMKLAAMRAGDYQTHFSLKNMLKDSRYALELAQASGLKTPVLEQTSQQMAAMETQGHGEDDFCALFRQFDAPQGSK
jgi:3-hydroxyisobutyrate dehydrogenase-like beta-hydroxyacid dehydrogenase